MLLLEQDGASARRCRRPTSTSHSGLSCGGPCSNKLDHTTACGTLHEHSAPTASWPLRPCHATECFQVPGHRLPTAPVTSFHELVEGDRIRRPNRETGATLSPVRPRLPCATGRSSLRLNFPHLLILTEQNAELVKPQCFGHQLNTHHISDA